MKPVPPVIVIGMSRSGTTMLTKMLEELGLYAGRQLTNNHEAVFFRKINDWLLTQCSGGLENPGVIRYLLQDSEARDLYAGFVEFTMKTPKAISFLGLGDYLKYRTPAALDVPWGWKDPRNTFTLPVWLDIFPGAKIVHIYRHPLDIVSSLRTRRKKGLSRLKKRGGFSGTLYRYLLVRRHIGTGKVFTDLRAASLDEGLLMWEEYMSEARKHVSDLGERAIEIRYEDFLESPVSVIKTLSDFCGLYPSQASIEKTAGGVNESRRLAFLKDPELQEYSVRISDRLKAYGY